MDASEEDQHYADLVRAVQELPVNHTVVWGDDHARLTDNVWRASWIDARSPELCEILQWGWTWTVLTPEDDDAPAPGQDSTTVVLAPDVDVHVAWNDATHWYDTEGTVFVTAPGQAISAEQRATLEDNGKPVVVAGWTLEAVNRALQEWCREHAGRGDLAFTYDDDLVSPSMEIAQGRLEDIENGAPTYQVGEGVYATAEVMDALLEMPAEDSAKVMKIINRVARATDGQAPEIN